MRSRRLILTLECVTTYTLAEIRAALTHVALSHGRWITRYPDNEDGMPNRIVQFQANAIRPEPKRAAARNRNDEEPNDGYTGGLLGGPQLKSIKWRSWQRQLQRKRKAKRAKGAK